MAAIVIAGKQFDLDDDGFIQQPELWDDAVAVELAKIEGINEMSEAHWKIVRYLRNYYVENQIAPMVRKLCKETGFTLKQVYELFTAGPAKGACKIAGLPKPTGCV